MASSRESSPAIGSSPPTPSQLTPNSKVKAMLAAFDDSDDDSVSGSTAAKLALLTRKSITSQSKASRQSTPAIADASGAQSPESSEKNDEEDEDEDEEIVRPKGRLAARMMAAHQSSDEDEPVAKTARERVLKLLSKPKSPQQAMSTKASEESEDDDVPVPSRKRKSLTARNSTPISSPRAATASPGMFVSPVPRRAASPAAGSNSDSDHLPANPAFGNRFKELVAKKRKERLEKEQELNRQKAVKAAERKRLAAAMDEEDGMENSDDDVEQRLTQTQRPTRRAGKKALEEMHRETQRLSRSMQLAHQAKTKKKITKASLFAKFNYKPAGYVDEASDPTRPASSSSTSAPHSDVEMRDTPPTSPPQIDELNKSAEAVEVPIIVEDQMGLDEAELPTFEQILSHIPSSPPAQIEKGKGKAIEEDVAPALVMKKPVFKQRPIRVRPPMMKDRKSSPLEDSDSDLEIVSGKTSVQRKMDDIFGRVPAKKANEASSMHALRMLAHLTSPGKKPFGKNQKPSMTTSELQMSLQQRARQQASREREERLQALRAKGIIVQTAEEREKELAEVEDLISKARREGEEIMRREKAAAKKERKARGEEEPLDGSSDDEEWQEEKENLREELSGSGSGSEGDEEELEDDEEDEVMSEGDDEVAEPNHLLDKEAADSEEEEANLSIDDDAAVENDEVEDEEVLLNANNRRARRAKVISDDEDEPEHQSPPLIKSPVQFESPMQRRTDSPIAPNSVLRSATKTFIPGVTVSGPAGLGLTQIFAGTMDDSQVDDLGSQTQAINDGHDSLAFLRRIPPPTLPPFEPTMEDSQDLVADSQSRASQVPESQLPETQAIQLNFSQSQIHGFDSLVEDPFSTQYSEFPEATQDAGFQHITPIRSRFAEPPPSTVDTVVIEPTILPETPIVKKKGKLRRRNQVTTFSDEDDAAPEPDNMDIDEDEFDITSNAFDVMRKALKRPAVVDNFDKKKSKAKEMVNEQAEESEDEYAGLGGASDDESGGEEDAFVKEMIDDAAGKDADASKIAAFYADRERANDEKQVEKLYNDITKGMLRRKRGADYDLSDSDDGGEAKRRMKRKEFARMRKALLADERIGKIAENPKRQAFLRAIEDRDSEDEMGFLDDFAEQGETTDSQSQSQVDDSQQKIPDSQPDTSMGPPKRKNTDDQYAENRPAPNLRRTQPSKKPANLSEIRESLSSLIEEPNAMIGPEDSGSESDGDLEIEGEPDQKSVKNKEKENRDPFALRRTNVAVIDRISLKRASSSNLSTNTRLAFSVSSSASSFKVPALLRRATTNNSVASTTSSISGGMASTTERMAGGAGSGGGVKRGGGKSSGVNYYARESERSAKLVKTEKKREQKRFKGAEVRRKVVGGLFGGGKFE
ncbi:Mediator of replication checkpoint protein 1 [Phlyctema vagabunda]|uniref:Mediator of replication checkpoint protein 1 n=1 Tax=Phlyctema vagabunda TaxID=108571 RepID=A0ABR4PM45_9HELO